MKRTQNEADIRQVLSVIEDYNTALTLLDNYDHQCMKRPQGNKAIYVLNYEECRKLIDQMRFVTILFSATTILSAVFQPIK